MQPSKNTLSDIKNPQTAWLWYGLSALVVGIDQLSKVYFENNFQFSAHDKKSAPTNFHGFGG